MAFYGFKNLSSLSTVDMSIYRYIEQNSDKVIYMRVRDIAQNAYVSSSSVMLFLHKISFNSFPEFNA
ncbi:MurR/RpiR family transcriptional regulator, partial [Lactobacillus acidophilus]|nr:MurR/RpiR family transcriptional regulator [Lactobacillus acidophilus]